MLRNESAASGCCGQSWLVDCCAVALLLAQNMGRVSTTTTPSHQQQSLSHHQTLHTSSDRQLPRPPSNSVKPHLPYLQPHLASFLPTCDTRPPLSPFQPATASSRTCNPWSTPQPLETRG